MSSAHWAFCEIGAVILKFEEKNQIMELRLRSILYLLVVVTLGSGCSKEMGCTDISACNFNLVAEEDDGSCFYQGDECDDGVASTSNDSVNAFCECEGVDGGEDGSGGGGEELSCEGTLALLTGCDNPKTWKFASDAGAIAIGPEPGSTEWYASPAGALVDFQYDDRWTLTEDGEFLYNNNGGSMNPFDGYIETLMTVQPSTYVLELEAGPNGEDLFTVGSLVTEAAEICGWMGVWDSGPTYTITELTEDRLVLSALQQGTNCVNPVGSGHFTLVFVVE